MRGLQLGVVRKKLGVVQKFNVVRTGVAAWQGHGKTRQGQKVQRGQNFKFNFVTLLSFWPCSASHPAEFVHMQRIYK